MNTNIQWPPASVPILFHTPSTIYTRKLLHPFLSIISLNHLLSCSSNLFPLFPSWFCPKIWNQNDFFSNMTMILLLRKGRGSTKKARHYKSKINESTKEICFGTRWQPSSQVNFTIEVSKKMNQESLFFQGEHVNWRTFPK